MAASVTEEKNERLRKHVRQAFILFEHKEGSRLVDIKDIPTALRACGVNPTQVQVRQACSSLLLAHALCLRVQLQPNAVPLLIPEAAVDLSHASLPQTSMVQDELAALNAQADMTSLISLEHWETVVMAFLQQNQASLWRDDYFQMLRAFRAFDPEGRGYVEVEQLKAALTTKGEALTEDELTKMFGFSADDQGRIYYEDYCQKVSNDGVLS